MQLEHVRRAPPPRKDFDMTSSKSAMRTAGRRPRVTLGAETLDRLEALAQGALRRNPGLAERLLEELGRARVVPAEKLPSDVVAIGRSVTYRDESTGLERTVTPVFPEEADISQGRISILTPIGVAMLGLAAGASFPWDTRTGMQRILTILHVAPTGKTEADR